MSAHKMTPRPTLTGSEILWATLAGEGVTTVFDYPGSVSQGAVTT
jgi:acetolactate synthase-1/2/3 large subunit